jgi:hypothetical protein
MCCNLARIFALLSFAALCLSGCTNSGPETVPVYGRVTFEGRDFPRICRIYFRPDETATLTRPAFVTAAPDGSYEVKAFQRSEGLLPATYQIQVTYFDLKPGANPDSQNGWIESRHDAGELVVESGSGGIEHNIVVPKDSSANKKRSEVKKILASLVIGLYIGLVDAAA